MASTVDSSTSVSLERNKPTGPDWEQVPFKVGCARCGHDLRGLAEPVCPACSLEFEWDEAVPIEHLTCKHCGYHLFGLSETRCPECGVSFNWDKVLDVYRRRQKPLFEYQWRRRPISSLGRTWWWVVRPRTLWSRLDIHDPPQVLPLLVLIGGSLVVFAVMLVLLKGMGDWLFWKYWVAQNPKIANRIVDPLPVFMVRSLSSPAVHVVFASAVVWSAASFAALMVFQQSMVIGRIRIAQVFRVWAYAVPVMLPVVALAAFIPTYIESFTTYLANWPKYPVIAGLFLIGFAIWSIRWAYKSYLRMSHSTAVAVASQVVAFLAFGAYELMILKRPGRGFFTGILDLVGMG